MQYQAITFLTDFNVATYDHYCVKFELSIATINNKRSAIQNFYCSLNFVKMWENFCLIYVKTFAKCHSPKIGSLEKLKFY